MTYVQDLRQKYDRSRRWYTPPGPDRTRGTPRRLRPERIARPKRLTATDRLVIDCMFASGRKHWWSLELAEHLSLPIEAVERALLRLYALKAVYAIPRAKGHRPFTWSCRLGGVADLPPVGEPE